MSGGEHRARAAEDHHPDLVVLLGVEERVVEFDEQPSVLCVACVRPVQHDPRDPAGVERLGYDEIAHETNGVDN